MLVSIVDTIEIADAHPTADGYLALVGRPARAGVYQYLGAELGLGDAGVVNVFRPESSVFDAASMASYAHKPVTNLHPSVNVTSANWTDLAKGWSGGDIKRDGEVVSVPMILADAALIADYKAGKVELSPGYTAEITAQKGQLSDGTTYDFVMGPPKINHIAVVPKGRGGATCRLGDAWPTVEAADTKPGDRTMNTKIVLVDGLQVETTDAGAAAITKLIGDIATRDASVAALNTAVADRDTTISARDGEIVALKKAIADAELTPAILDAAVAARAVVLDHARKVLGKDFTGAGLTDAAIRKAAVAKQLGDTVVADMDDAAIGGAFKVIEGAKVTAKDTIAAVVLDGVAVSDATTGIEGATQRALDARQAMIDGLNGTPAAGEA